jgi:hypothetical protein
MSVSFLVQPQNQVRRFVTGLVLKPLGRFFWFDLKTGGNGFLRFGLKTVSDSFSQFDLKTDSGFFD